MSTLVNNTYVSSKFSIAAGQALTHTIDVAIMVVHRSKYFLLSVFEVVATTTTSQKKITYAAPEARQHALENLQQLAKSVEKNQPTLAAELRGYANCH